MDEPTNGPPLYSGVATPAAVGYYQSVGPNPGLPPGNSSGTGGAGGTPNVSQWRREPGNDDKTIRDESEFYEPASISVQHLNVSLH